MSTTPAPRKKKLKSPTWEHPKGSGIKIAQMPNKTGGVAYRESFQIRIPAELTGGKRELVQRKTQVEAERLAEDRFVALKKHGTEFSKIPADAQKKAALAWSLVTEAARESGLKLDFIEVVKAGLRSLNPAGGLKTLADVVAELVASKELRQKAGKLDASTLHDFKVRTNRIAASLGTQPIGSILHTEISGWLAKLAKDGAQFGGALGARSVRNYRNTLSEIFRHAKGRRYCAENPFDRFTKEDLKTHGGLATEKQAISPNILTVSEARMLLDSAQLSKDPGMLASTVLRLFCGVRTTEVCRLDWSEVRAWSDTPHVLIPAGKAKKRRIRDIELPANALAWLKLCPAPAKGLIIPGNEDVKKKTKAFCKRFGKVVRDAGIAEWENNDTRHSFGSYHLALHGDSRRTATLMGHKQSDEVLFTSYRALVTKAQATEFFGIVPAGAAEKVTEFPQAAALG